MTPLVLGSHASETPGVPSSSSRGGMGSVPPKPGFLEPRPKWPHSLDHRCRSPGFSGIPGSVRICRAVAGPKFFQ